MTAVYVHIPFCEHICYYCDFNKVFLEGQPVDAYLDAMEKEIIVYKQRYDLSTVDTLYIGGGTPTSLTAVQLDRLMQLLYEHLPLSECREFTIEANPGDITEDKIRVLQDAHVNRVSMGVQTFDDRLLKRIGRKHCAQDVYDTTALLRRYGFDNITIDLIYALPHQTVAQFMDSVKQAMDLAYPHLAMYALILENQTVFANLARQGKLHRPTEDEEVEMFEVAKAYLAQYGLQQYEISNFAKPGYESQHNLTYWNNEHYLGIGAGASGYLGNERYRNKGPIQHYIDDLSAHQRPIAEVEQLTIHQQMEEHLFLGLRKNEGVTYDSFMQRFQRSLVAIYGDVIHDLCRKGWLVADTKGIRLTEQGFLFGNDVFEAFLLED